MTGQTTEPGTRNKFPTYKPRKQKSDKDSLGDLDKERVRVVDENGKESKADTRVFKIGGAPIEKFRGSESAEFAIMRLVEKTRQYHELRQLHASDTDREIEAIGILGAALPNSYEEKAKQIFTTEQCPVFELLDEAKYKPEVLNRYFTQEEVQGVLNAIKAKAAKNERGIEVGDMLELMLVRAQLDGKNFSLIGAVETDSRDDRGNAVKRKEIYGFTKTPPYRVIEQDIPGHGKRLWVEPAFSEKVQYFASLGENVPFLRKNKQERALNSEEQQRLVIHAQLHQQSDENYFRVLKLGVKFSECHQFQKGDDVYGGVLPAEQVEDSLNNYFFDRIESETKTPTQTPAVKADTNADTKKVVSRRIKKNGTTTFRAGFDAD